jgi:glycine hydroxymethyltransferase
MSPAAKRVLRSDLENRALPGEIGLRHHMGAKHVDEIEALTVELARKLFKADYIEYRPVTTSIANAIAIRCLTDVGDTILALERPRAHDTWREIGYAGFRGLEVIDIPFDYENWNIDIDQLATLVGRMNQKPKLMIIGTSVFLFPHPLRKIREMAHEINATVMYDGAHVLGLIAGGKFQDPLSEGADLLIGTVSKTLSGPMGGLIIHNNGELDEKIHSVFYGHLASTGHNRTAALAVTMAEMLEYGQAFAEQIIINAKALGRALDQEGFRVPFENKGYTESHTIILDVSRFGGGDNVAKRLENANIICSAYMLRRTDEPHHALRLGVTEMTRYGMKEPEMEKIAQWIRRVAIDKRDPKKISKEVIEFRSQFTKVGYCFDLQTFS